MVERDYIMDIDAAELEFLRLNSRLPEITKKHLSVDVLLNGMLWETFYPFKGQKSKRKISPKNKNKIVCKLYLDKADGISWE